jgi:hypothetical protein
MICYGLSWDCMIWHGMAWYNITLPRIASFYEKPAMLACFWAHARTCTLWFGFLLSCINGYRLQVMEKVLGTNLCNPNKFQPNRSMHEAKTCACCMFLIEGGISGQSDKNKKSTGYTFMSAKSECASVCKSQKMFVRGLFLIEGKVMVYHAIQCHIMPSHDSLLNY